MDRLSTQLNPGGFGSAYQPDDSDLSARLPVMTDYHSVDDSRHHPSKEKQNPPTHAEKNERVGSSRPFAFHRVSSKSTETREKHPALNSLNDYVNNESVVPLNLTELATATQTEAQTTGVVEGSFDLGPMTQAINPSANQLAISAEMRE